MRQRLDCAFEVLWAVEAAMPAWAEDGARSTASTPDPGAAAKGLRHVAADPNAPASDLLATPTPDGDLHEVYRFLLEFVDFSPRRA